MAEDAVTETKLARGSFRLEPRQLEWLDHRVAVMRRERKEALRPGEEMEFINRGHVVRDLIDKAMEAEQ